MQKQYICGCGKAYGSYPAFSTHRKLKHQNQLIEGTILPSQDKAKRGRPSYDFKKIPKLKENEKKYYAGLSLIENQLLILQSQFRGKILSQPMSISQEDIKTESIKMPETQNQENKERLQCIIQFIRLIIIHTQQKVSIIILDFMQRFLNFALQNNELLSMSVYNNFFKQKQNIQKIGDFGLEFEQKLCVLLSKWLFLMGKTSETLRPHYLQKRKEVKKEQI